MKQLNTEKPTIIKTFVVAFLVSQFIDFSNLIYHIIDIIDDNKFLDRELFCLTHFFENHMSSDAQLLKNISCSRWVF